MNAYTIAQALDWAKNQLATGESPAIDARVLICHVLDCNPTWLMTYPEQVLSGEQVAKFQSMVKRRVNGEPVSYITGTQDFWSLTLKVNPNTLIPRPETELLVEKALALLEVSNPRILDLGTGTGAIALALASELPNSEVVAVDRVEEAVLLAKENALQLGLDKVQIFQSDWFDAIPEQNKFDLIVTNPPYVESGSEWLTQGDVRFEPDSALVAGDDGLDDIRYIISQARDWLNPNGWLLIEHGYEQGTQIQNFFIKSYYHNPTLVRDYSDLPRVSYAQKVVA